MPIQSSGFNFGYLIFMLPGLLLSLWAQAKVKGAYSKWSQVQNSGSVTGVETAEHLKPRVGLQNVTVTRVQGQLTVTTIPQRQTGPQPGCGRCPPQWPPWPSPPHELGHALQDKEGYGPMRLRQMIVPLVGLGSNIGLIHIMIGWPCN